MSQHSSIGALLRRFPHLSREPCHDPAMDLVLGGVLPMVHKGTTYHLPVVIQFPKGYPLRGPVCWLRPGPGMVVDPTHSLVDTHGRVKLRELNEWTGQSDLTAVVEYMASVFGNRPPLYAAPSPGAPPPSATSSSRPGDRISTGHGPTTTTTTTTSTTTMATTSQHQHQHQQHQQHPPVTQAQTQAQTHTVQTHTVQTHTVHPLHAVLAAELSRTHESHRRDLSRLLGQRSLLLSGGCELREARAMLEREARGGGEWAAEVEERAREAVRWLGENAGARVVVSGEGAAGTSDDDGDDDGGDDDDDLGDGDDGQGGSGRVRAPRKEFDVRDIVRMGSSKEEALFRLAAEDEAAEDTLYALQQGLKTGAIGLDAWIKVARAVAHDQFLIRARRLALERS